MLVGGHDSLADEDLGLREQIAADGIVSGSKPRSGLSVDESSVGRPLGDG